MCCAIAVPASETTSSRQSGSPKFQLTSEEQACSVREPLWRLLVVSDAGTAIAQHKIYKPSEMSQAPGFEAQG